VDAVDMTEEKKRLPGGDTTIRIRTDPDPAPQALLPSSLRRDDAMKVVTVANVALVGIPAAYATSQSVPITVLAALAAPLFVLLYLRHNRDS
jgi:hypothetical protein